MKFIVTGSAGFIGFHLCKTLIKNKKNRIIGLDNLNNYYSVKLKKDRLSYLKKININKNFLQYKIDISNYKKLEKIFKKIKPDFVINLAAQAGVRYSLKHPEEYLKNNMIGFFNIMDLSKKYKIKHLVYASTSSVYGLNKKMPFSENFTADHPIQFYAATKRSNEIMAHSYSYLYNLPTTGLRFFTVYGPWSRPDMSLYNFAENISKNKKIEVFNYGNHVRDFTYVDDIVDGIIKSIFKLPKKKKLIKPNPGESPAPFQIFNIGNNRPIKLMDYIKLIEKNLQKKAIIKYLPLQPGDIHATKADIKKISKILKYKPKTNIKDGIRNFIDWFKKYKKLI
jgi:UDP-glucuronate 4-epimerase